LEKVTGKPRLRGAERTAALLLAMGKENADRIVRHFGEEDLKHLARTAATLGRVPRSAIDSLVDELAEAVSVGADLMGNDSVAEQLISGFLPEDQAAELMSDLRGDAGKVVWPRLAKMPDSATVQYILKEHPQVAAFMLSKLAPNVAASVISQLPLELRRELTRRMLTIKPVLDAPVRILEEVLAQHLITRVARSDGPDIHARLADIINKLDREQMDEVLTGLEEYRPKEAKIVRGLLFTFDDIVKLSLDVRSRLFDEVPPDMVLLALRGAEKNVTEAVLEAVSVRARRIIEQELTSGSTGSRRDILQARRAIADLALDMANRGLIEINNDDDYT